MLKLVRFKEVKKVFTMFADLPRLLKSNTDLTTEMKYERSMFYNKRNPDGTHLATGNAPRIFFYANERFCANRYGLEDKEDYWEIVRLLEREGFLEAEAKVCSEEKYDGINAQKFAARLQHDPHLPQEWNIPIYYVKDEFGNMEEYVDISDYRYDDRETAKYAMFYENDRNWMKKDEDDIDEKGEAYEEEN